MVNLKEILHIFDVEAVKHIEHVVAVVEGFLVIAHELAGHHHQLVVEELAESFTKVFLHASFQFLALEAFEESHRLNDILHQTGVLFFWETGLKNDLKKMKWSYYFINSFTKLESVEYLPKSCGSTPFHGANLL